MPGLDLTVYENPLGPVTLPNGRVAPTVDFNEPMRQLYAGVWPKTNDPAAVATALDKLNRLTRLCIPSLTDDEFAVLSEGMKYLIAGHCNGNLAQTVEFLGNVGRAAELAAGAAAGSPPSSPTTRSSTPSRGSRGPSAGRGGSRRTPRSTRPSSPPTASTS